MMQSVASRAKGNKVREAVETACVDLNKMVEVDSQYPSARWYGATIASFGEHFVGDSGRN